MNSNKVKGDKAEREACALLTEFTDYEVERRFGAGMENDKGDCLLYTSDAADE